MKATSEAIRAFCEALTEVKNASFRKHGDTTNTVRFVPSPGGKVYVRIVQQSYVCGKFCQDSAHTFVKVEDGTLWKPAGWKGPAKNFPRGSVFDLPATSYVGTI